MSIVEGNSLHGTIKALGFEPWKGLQELMAAMCEANPGKALYCARELVRVLEPRPVHVTPEVTSQEGAAFQALPADQLTHARFMELDHGLADLADRMDGVFKPTTAPPHDSLEEAQMAAGWPQEAQPATVRVKPSAIAGKTFAFTGVLPTLSRDDACIRIEEAGGVIVSAVSAKLDYLVAGSEAGSKLLKALELGVPVIGETQLLRLVAPKPSAFDEMAYMLCSHGKQRDRIVGASPALGAPYGIDATLVERGSRYGKFEDHAAITMQLKNALRQRIYENATKFQADQLEAIDMICHKLGRIVNGDPNYVDSWVDIAGYAKLVADRLEGVSR